MCIKKTNRWLDVNSQARLRWHDCGLVDVHQVQPRVIDDVGIHAVVQDEMSRNVNTVNIFVRFKLNWSDGNIFFCFLETINRKRKKNQQDLGSWHQRMTAKRIVRRSQLKRHNVSNVACGVVCMFVSIVWIVHSQNFVCMFVSIVCKSFTVRIFSTHLHAEMANAERCKLASNDVEWAATAENSWNEKKQTNKQKITVFDYYFSKKKTNKNWKTQTFDQANQHVQRAQ